MPRLTKQHFEWLAHTIGPMIQNKEMFIKEVKIFSKNSNFCQYRFRDAIEDAIADAQAYECGPDLYKLADYKEN